MAKAPQQQAKREPDADLLLALTKHSDFLLHAEGAEGEEQADFTGADLHDIDFGQFSLERAIFKRANLKGADLSRTSSVKGADFSGADLSDATLDGQVFTNTDLHGTRLNDASLQNVTLTDALGLQARQLRGSDLTGAKLPPAIADSLNSLPGVDEATKTSRKVFLTMLAACLYCWLTITSTTDLALLTGNSTLALPVVQTPIPVVAFFGAAPILLSIVYLYLHFSLQNLWEALATLPAIFPDGRPLDQRATPWIMGPIVRTQFKRLGVNYPRLPEFLIEVSQLLAWWAVPLTLLAFWARFIVRHDARITVLHIAAVVAAVWLAQMFWRITRQTLSAAPPNLRRWYGLRPSRESLVAVFVASVLGAFVYAWSFGMPIPARLVTIAGDLGWHPYGVLDDQALSVKPPGWDGKDLTAVKGVQLSDRFLQNLYARGAFAVNGEFYGADLRGANLFGSDLRGAAFMRADLTNANFAYSDLRGAVLYRDELSAADFTHANLQGAHLKEARLHADQVLRADNWFLAHLDDDVLVELGVCAPSQECDHEDRLQRKDFSGLNMRPYGFSRPDFSGANLRHSILPFLEFNSLHEANYSKADLRNADFSKVDLDGANLEGADLRGTDLTGATGLTRSQIESALTDEKTKLPGYLEAQKPFTPRKTYPPK